MRLIAMLAALLIIGTVVYKQISPNPDQPIEALKVNPSSSAPKISSNPNDVKQFGKQMDAYLKEETAKRAAELEKMEGL